jgi:hypothetical protein
MNNKWNIFGTLAALIIQSGAKKATKYFSDKLVVKATRRGKLRKNERETEILFTFGRPNYAEREFIKRCKIAGEPFPVKKAQLKFAVV